MNSYTLTEFKDDELSIINEFKNKLNNNQAKSLSQNCNQLKFIDGSVAKIVNTTINELNSNKNSAIMPLVHETINDLICNFTQSYPDIPMAPQSDSCNEDVKPQTLVEKPFVNNNNIERCFNLIENGISIPSDDSENIIINYICEYNPEFKEITLEKSDLIIKPKNIKRNKKVGTKDFHLVLNIGFGYSSKGIILQCFAANCNFKSYDRDIFEAHYVKCHYITKFEGACKSCEQNLNIVNISQELNHIYDCHRTEKPKPIKEDTLSSETVLLSEIPDVKAESTSLIDHKQIDDLIKQLEEMEKDTEETAISSEADIAVVDNSVMSQVTSSEPTEILSETPKEILSTESEVSVSTESEVSVSTESEVSVSSSGLKSDHENIVEIDSNQELNKKEKKKRGTKRLKSMDSRSVVSKKYKTEKPPTPTLYLRVSLDKLTDETIAKYLNTKKRPGRPRKPIYKKSYHEEPSIIEQDKFKKSYHEEPSSIEQDKSLQNKDLNKISHKSIKITKKITPTIFKRSLSLHPSRSEIIPERSTHVDEPDKKPEILKIILKKCDIGDIGSNYYKVHNPTNDSIEPHSGEENSEKIENTKSEKTEKETTHKIPKETIEHVEENSEKIENTNSESKEKTKKVTTNKLPKETEISTRKLFDDALMLLDEAKRQMNKSKKRLKRTSVDKTSRSKNTTPINNEFDSQQSPVTEKDSNEESSTAAKDSYTEVPSTNKPIDNNNNDCPSPTPEQSNSKSLPKTQIIPRKTTVEEKILKSPLKTNHKQSSIDKTAITEDLPNCTFPNDVKSPQSTKSSSPRTSNPPITISTPTCDPITPDTHINFSLLQPWLDKRSHNKYAISCHTQLQKNGLLARYRCMGSTCSFYTSNKWIYTSHLKQHKNNEEGKVDTFLYCSNCIYHTNNIEKLVNHVTIVHRFDRYQCPYCFYRSCESQSCITHVNKHHQYLEKHIMECSNDDLEPTDADKLTSRLNSNRAKYVAPFKCPLCKKKYYLGDAYISHIKIHDDELERPIVHNAILFLQKLMDENHYGLNQCVYCVYGSKTEDEMRVHLSNCHPSEYTYYCKRESSAKTNISAEFLESTQLIKLGKE